MVLVINPSKPFPAPPNSRLIARSWRFLFLFPLFILHSTFCILHFF